MKRKIYFVLSSISCIILTIYTMINSNEIIKKQIVDVKKSFNSFGSDFTNRTINLLQKSGSLFIILFGVIVILFNTIILYYIKKDKLFKRKGSIITFSIISLFLTESSFLQVFCIINLAVMITSEKEKDDTIKTKKEIPEIDYIKSSKKELLFGILLLLAYFSQFLWGKLIPDDFNIYIMCLISFDILMFILCVSIFFKNLKKDFRIFKDNFIAYIKFILSRLGIGYLILIFCNYIVMLITKNATSVNQQALESMPIWYTIPAAILFAPIVEEILFRGVFRRIISNNYLFIVISSVSFGLLHTINEAGLFNIIIMSVPYIVLGSILSYLYSKTNNIWTNITCHSIINIIAAIFTLLI